MILMETSSVPSLALPIADLKQHLCLGTGFEDDDLQDEVLETCLRAAISTIEGHSGQVLLEKQFMFQLTTWRSLSHQILPARPVKNVDNISIKDRNDILTIIDPSNFVIRPMKGEYALEAKMGSLPTIPSSGVTEVTFRAGYGTLWADVPSDLQNATLCLATSYYESRSGGGHVLPPAVNALLAKYKPVRLGLNS